MRVEALFLHPVKSLRAVPVQALVFDAHGPEHDREWMLVDAQGRFLSQRATPSLARLTPSLLEGGGLRVELEGRAALEVGAGDGGASRTVSVWDDEVEAVDCGDLAARWCSEATGVPCRLVRFPAGGRRLVDPAFAPRPDATTRFSDGYPALVVNLTSLEDVNAHLPAPLPVERFRPNVVVRAGRPWEEDGWRALALGGLAFDAVKPCGRCVVITTDQRTGERPQGKAPLEVLASRHTLPGFGAVFGQNLVHRGPGVVRVGDVADVLGISGKDAPHASS